MRPHEASPRSRWLDVLSFVVFCAATVIALMTARDYGLGWDEPVHASYGDALLRYFASFGKDHAAVAHRDHAYGPAYDLFAAVVLRWSPFEAWDSLRFSGAFVGLLGLIGAFRIGRLLGGPLGGLLSMVFLWITPVYYGHIFNNPKDVPFAVAYLWAIYYLVRIALELPRVSIGLWIKLGAVVGMALGVRIGGFLLFGYAGAIVALHLVELAVRRRGWLAFSRSGVTSIGGFALSAAVGYGVLIALWPWAQQHPIDHLVDAVHGFSAYRGFPGTTLYDGNHYRPAAIPRDYVFAYFVRLVPESVLALLCGAAIWVAVQTLFAPIRRRPLPLATGVVFVSALAPLVVATVRHMPLYDGIRHLLFTLPASCALAGIAASRAMRWLVERQRMLAFGLGLCLAFITADTARSMIELHPYQYVHYNRASGGYAAAEGKWDTDYYGHSYREAYGRLMEHLWRTEPERYLSRSYRTIGADSPFHHHQQSTENFDFLGLFARGADFYTSSTRYRFDLHLRPHPIITMVKRQGTVLCVTRDLRR